jgi:hypothetical protein
LARRVLALSNDRRALKAGPQKPIFAEQATGIGMPGSIKSRFYWMGIKKTGEKARKCPKSSVKLQSASFPTIERLDQI